MAEFRLPYGHEHLIFNLPDRWQPEILAPAPMPALRAPVERVRCAMDAPVGPKRLTDFSGARSVGIAVNDKTRPVPLAILLPPLVQRLVEMLSLPPSAIRLFVATGMHPPMTADELYCLIPPEISERCPVICHNADDRENTAYLGQTRRGTPVWINRRFVDVDLRIVVGNIEPHQFMGFSGGSKVAAIGLAGRETVNHNHALMTDPRATLGRFHDNPARQDVDEIGRMIDVHFALNAVVNEKKEIVEVLAGEPGAVMQAGIPLVLDLYRAPVSARLDLMIASPGGHPKDINLYQAQKALAHAALVSKDGATVVLGAECPEGTGSHDYENWMNGMTSFAAVFERFEREGFRIGPHKAFQIARDASRVRVILVSKMPPHLVRRLLLTPCGSLSEAVEVALQDLTPGARIGVMPWANATIPVLPE